VTEKKASDLFVTAGFPPAIKLDGEIRPQSERALTVEQSATLVRAIMNDRQTKEFDATKECNFAIAPPGIGRFRVSAFVQQAPSAASSASSMPRSDVRGARPAVHPEGGRALEAWSRHHRRGTGSGKSTTLAAMVGLPQREDARTHRDDRGPGRVRPSAQGLRDHAP